MEQILCKHGNYHCLICEVKLLKLVIEEQDKHLNIAVTALKQISLGYTSDYVGRAKGALSQIGEPKGKGDKAHD